MPSSMLYKLDPEIKKTFHLRMKKQRIEKQIREVRRNPTRMAGGRDDQRRTLRDFVTPGVQGIASSIARTTSYVNNLKLKLALISMVQ